MGEVRRDALWVGFDRAIKVEFHGAEVSSDAGLFPYRDLDEAAQLTDSCPSGPTWPPDRRLGAELDLSSSIPVRSKQLVLGFPGGVCLRREFCEAQRDR